MQTKTVETQVRGTLRKAVLAAMLASGVASALVGTADAASVPAVRAGSTPAPAAAASFAPGGSHVLLPASDETPEDAKQCEAPEASDGHGFFHTLYGAVSALLTGIMGFSPLEVQESVEIVEEAAPSIAEKVDNVEAYNEAYPDEHEETRAVFRADCEGSSEGKNVLYRWFWGLWGLE